MKIFIKPIWLKCYIVTAIILGVFFLLMYSVRPDIIEEHYPIRISVNVVFVLWILIDIFLKRLAPSYTTKWGTNIIFIVYVFFIIGSRGVPSPYRYDWVCHTAVAFYLANQIYSVIKREKQRK